MNIIGRIVVRTCLYIFIMVSFYGCEFEPTLLEHREAMTEHEGYQQYKIPTRYILRVVDLNDTTLGDCYLQIRGNDSFSGRMEVMSSSAVAGFPQAYQYFIIGLASDEVDSIDFIFYRYVCEYESKLFGRRGAVSYPPRGDFQYENALFFEKESSKGSEPFTGGNS
jgi:hypothetical protein